MTLFANRIKRGRKRRADLRNLERESKRLNEELVNLAGHVSDDVSDRLDRMADVQDRLRLIEQEISVKSGEVELSWQNTVDEDELARALAEFDPVWGALNAAEQTRLVRAIIDRVEFDGSTGQVGVTFKSSGLKEICAMTEVA